MGFLEGEQGLIQRIQIQIKHDMPLCFRGFNTLSEEILVGSFISNQSSGGIIILGWKAYKCFKYVSNPVGTSVTTFNIMIQ